MSEEVEEMEIPEQKDKEDKVIKKLALDVVDGKIFGSWMIRENESTSMIGMVFMPLLLGAKLPKNIIHVYEYFDKAGPRAINGYPIFFSCCMLTTKDIEVLKQYIDVLVKAKQAFLGEPEEEDDVEQKRSKTTQGTVDN